MHLSANRVTIPVILQNFMCAGLFGCHCGLYDGKRSVFDEVGGLTEELAVAFNDIDFCLKVRKTGKLVVYDPYAEWFHYESKSRGYEDSPEKVERFNDEVDTLLRSWREIIEQGDPYYNPNLTLDNSDFSLRK